MTTEMVNTPVAVTLSSVSLVPTETNTTIGGSEDTTVN